MQTPMTIKQRQQVRQDLGNIGMTFLVGAVVVFMSFPVLRWVA